MPELDVRFEWDGKPWTASHSEKTIDEQSLSTAANPTPTSLSVVPSPAQAHAIEVLEGVLAKVRESRDTQGIVIAVQYGSRMATRYTGSVLRLLGLAARLAHDINKDIDDDNE